MITQAEAKMRAARLALGAMTCIALSRDSPDRQAIHTELDAIETWLRRRAVGGDKIAIRQMERPTGRQVKPGKKDARRLGGA